MAGHNGKQLGIALIFASTSGLYGCGSSCIDDGFIGGDCAAASAAGSSGGPIGSTGDPIADSGDASLDDTSDTPTSGQESGDSDSSAGPDSTGTDSGTGDVQTLCPDEDSDGFANLDECIETDPDDAPPGHIPPTDQGDCDDDDADTFPGAAESKDPNACTKDSDDDGFGDANPPPGVDPGTDCDDDDPKVSDCGTLWCLDDDGDGFGNPDECEMGGAKMPPSEDHVTNADDCDDTSGSVFPGAATAEPTLCTLDADGDGFGPVMPPPGADPGTDCDDGSDFTFPGAAQLEAPPLDGQCLRDEDDDGFGDEAPPAGVTAGTDCADQAPTVIPGAAALEPSLCTADVDGDGWGDWDAPSIDANADEGSDCDDADPGVERCALLVTQDGTDDEPVDAAIRTSLEAMGLTVQLAEDLFVGAGAADPAALVVISETSFSIQVGNKFRNVDEPVICLEALIWDDMDMAPVGVSVPEIQVEIVDDTHPIAAGLSGVVDFMIDDPGSGIFHTAPNASAQVIASRVGTATEVAVFAFEAGVVMEDALAAPGRRVGFGSDVDTDTAQFGVDGLQMFEAAVTWALE